MIDPSFNMEGRGDGDLILERFIMNLEESKYLLLWYWNTSGGNQNVSWHLTYISNQYLQLLAPCSALALHYTRRSRNDIPSTYKDIVPPDNGESTMRWDK